MLTGYINSKNVMPDDTKKLVDAYMGEGNAKSRVSSSIINKIKNHKYFFSGLFDKSNIHRPWIKWGRNASMNLSTKN